MAGDFDTWFSWKIVHEFAESFGVRGDRCPGACIRKTDDFRRTFCGGGILVVEFDFDGAHARGGAHQAVEQDDNFFQRGAWVVLSVAGFLRSFIKIFLLGLLESFEHRFFASPSPTDGSLVDQSPMVEGMVVLDSPSVPPPVIGPELFATEGRKFDV
jgi:hypothetical protein